MSRKRTRARDVADPAPLADAVMELQQLARCLNEAVGMLTAKEQIAVWMAFGLEDGVERTTAEIAERLGVTPAAAYQTKARALRKLWHPRRKRLFAWAMHGVQG